jgi:predicted nuclease with TOPRIM domain
MEENRGDNTLHRVADLEGWKNRWNEELRQLSGSRRDTNNRLQELFVFRNEHEEHANDLHRLKDDYGVRVGGLENWKKDADAEYKKFKNMFKAKLDAPDFNNFRAGVFTQFDKYDSTLKEKVDVSDYKTDKNVLSSWQDGATKSFGRIDSWMKDMPSGQEYVADKKKNDDAIAQLAESTKALNDAHKGLENKTNPLFSRLNTLESRANDLEKRVCGHDGKFKDFDGAFTELGNRITKQGRKMDEGFRTILEEIRTGQEETRTGITTKAAPGIPIAIATPIVAAEGRNGGADREIGGDGRKGLKGGDRGLTKYQSNYESPGGINVANYGQLSVQHAPDCTRFSNSSRNDNSNNQYVGYCPCQPLFAPPDLYGCYGGRSGGWNGLGPCIRPPIRIWDPSEGRYERRRRDDSDLQEGVSNFNITPNITLGFSRQGGGGLFSKGKRENLFFELGNRGGGKRKHKPRDSA